MLSTKRKSLPLPINLWERIELVVGRNGEQGIYVSRVEDFDGDGVLISKPDFIGGGKLLTANARVEVQFMRPDALYRFAASVRVPAQRPNGELGLFGFGPVERVQRRQFVRVDMRLEIKYAPLTQAGTGLRIGDLRWYGSHTINVSAGGMLLKVSNQIGKGDHLLLKIARYEEMGIPRLLTAICCRVLRLEDGRFAGVEFITDRKLEKHFSATEIAMLPEQVKGFSAVIQNRLVKYLFEQQVRDRQKGRL